MSSWCSSSAFKFQPDVTSSRSLPPSPMFSLWIPLWAYHSAFPLSHTHHTILSLPGAHCDHLWSLPLEGRLENRTMILNHPISQALVAHTCNPSY
jgi:hypothetical protein